MPRIKHTNICHPDPFDEAKEIEQLERQHILNEHKNRPRVNAPVDVVDGVHYCIDCGDEMDDIRVKICHELGDTPSYCVECKSIMELMDEH